ncbi:MAG: hypothetical protein ACI8QS_001291 [Planctomycetota bacterium]|jgi:hypothetical protein
MGSHTLRPLQAFYSSFKVPLLLLMSTALCMPSFFILNTILGLREDFHAACRGVYAAQATIGVALVSLIPVLLVVYLGTPSYQLIQVLNGLLFLIATLAGQFTLARHYRALIRRNSRHRIPYVAWVLLYVFVAIQSAWVLRPFIGNPRLPVGFFRPDPWNNAYIEIGFIVDQVLGRLLSS